MNPITLAINHVKYTIPMALLEKVFINGSFGWRAGPKSSIDDQILNLVIRPRVMMNCDLVGGVQAVISLEGLNQVRPENWITIIHIPKDRTDGRTITAVLDVSYYSAASIAGYGNAGAAGIGAFGGPTGFNEVENSAMVSALTSVVGAMDKIPMISTARVSLIAENTIMIKDGVILSPNSFARVMLANDENLSNLQIRSYPDFFQLVEFAVKAYIYNELVITVDTAELRYGQALGIFKDILSSYSDAEANYQTFLAETWKKVAFMNDHETYTRLLKLMIGGQR